MRISSLIILVLLYTTGFSQSGTLSRLSVQGKYPLMLTEIGFAGEEERGAHVPVISDESYGEAITAYCDSRNISYVVWVFDPRWAPALFSDWNYTLTRHGKYFKQHMTQY